MIKILFPLLLFISVAMSDGLYNNITTSLYGEMGKNFLIEQKLFAKNPQYVKLLQVVNQPMVKREFGSRKMMTPNFEEIINTLDQMKNTSDSFLPSLYAYKYVQWSFGFKNQEFNIKQGVGFANNLTKYNRCEGYLWLAKIQENSKDQYKNSYENYTKAKKVCIGKYKKEAMLGAAMMKYLSGQSNKSSKK